MARGTWVGFVDADDWVTKDMYEYLVDKVGSNIIFYLDNNNIKKFIKQDKNELDKYFNIFNYTNNKYVPGNITNDNFLISLLNFRFSREKNEITETEEQLDGVKEAISGTMAEYYK